MGGIGAFEDLSGVNPDLGPRAGKARSIADQAAGRAEFTRSIDRRNGMACRQRHELLAPAEEEGVAADGERADTQLDKGGEGGLEIALGAGLQNSEVHPLRTRRFL